MKTYQAWVVLMLATLVGSPALAQQEYFVADRFAGEVFILRDLNGDGDALDVGENVLWADGLVSVTDLRSYQSSILAIDEATDEIVRLTDLNEDGDALDVGEAILWADGFASLLGLSVGAGDVVYATDIIPGEVLRLEDLNEDGDALDVGEQTTYASGPASPTGVWARQGDLLVADFIAGGVQRLVDLNQDGDALDVGENLSQAPPASIGMPLGILLGQEGEYFVSSELSDIVYRVEDGNGDGDALDIGEVLPYANPVLGGIDLPWHMTRHAAGGFLVSEVDDDEVTRMRDINGDGDALDVGEVVPFATITDPSALIAGVGPGAVGTMITIQDGPGTLDVATPNFVAIVEQSTVDRAVINAALNTGTDVLVSSDNPASFAPGRIVQNANAPIEKTAGGDATLAIRADDSIELSGGITSTVGTLDVELVANDAAQAVHDLDLAAGDVLVAGNIDTLGGDLTTSGVNFDNTGGPITADGVTMIHTGAITIAALLDADTINLTAGGGTTITSAGRLVGDGTVTGDLDNDGDFAPGSTPGIVNILGAYTQDPATGVLEIELAGSGGVPGTDFDQLVATGNVTLGGMLDVSLINPFSLSPGQSFEIIDTGGALSGTFSGLAEGGLVGNFAGTNLLITYLGGDGNDVTLLSALPGDFDLDGDVDGFDFLEWQRGESPNPLSQSDLADWEANYGMVAPLAAVSAVVPEPATFLMLLIGMLALHFRRDVVVF